MEANTRKMPDCPVEITLQLIGDKWKVLIIRDLLTGTKRFNELMRSVTGITQKVLTSHLRAMEAAGLVSRKVYAEVPPRVEYTLTETGYSLKPHFGQHGGLGRRLQKENQLTSVRPAL